MYRIETAHNVMQSLKEVLAFLSKLQLNFLAFKPPMICAMALSNWELYLDPSVERTLELLGVIRYLLMSKAFGRLDALAGLNMSPSLNPCRSSVHHTT